MRQIALLGVTMLLSACATTYSQPDESEPHARMILEKGYLDGLGFGTSTTVTYAVEDMNSCDPKPPEGLATFSWANAKTKTKSIAVGQPISLLASITKYDSLSGGGYWNGTAYIANMITDIPCTSRAVFTPEDGKTYRMQLKEVSKNVCELILVDTATEDAPVDASITNGAGPRCETTEIEAERTMDSTPGSGLETSPP